MRITSEDVQAQKFRVRFRGFDVVEVDAFLQRVADEIGRLIDERDGLRADLDAEKKARASLDEAIGALRLVQEGILEHARGQAETVVTQAQLRADRILADANEDLIRIRREVQQLKERRSAALAELAGAASSLQEWVARTGAEAAPDVPSLIAEEESEEPGQEGAGSETGG